MKIKGDSFDIEQLQHLAAQSGAYALVRERLTEAHTRAGNDLKTADTWDKVIRLQERIATLEMVLALPRILMDELRTAAKSPPRRA